jgi:Leucine-rich repeat (LRR) protein
MSLSSLCLVGCGLKKLPFTFGSYFSALSDLNLSSNQLKSLPQSMQKMTSLKSLRLNDNLLSKVPTSVHSFSRLERFEASNNKISDISALMSCISLKVIIMKGNPTKAPLDLPIRLKHLSILDLDENEDD